VTTLFKRLTKHANQQRQVKLRTIPAAAITASGLDRVADGAP
jgi:hypothetical protein